MVYLSFITESYAIEGRGWAICCDAVAKAVNIRVGDAIELRSPNRKEIRTLVLGIALFYDSNPDLSFEPLSILISKDVPRSFVERGVEVWKVS